MFKILAGILFGLCSMAVHAHVVLDIQQSAAGSYYRGALRVGHGCDGSAVTQLIVTIPAGVQGAKPMPKAGWRTDIRRTVLATPYLSHGREVREDVSEIRWTANTPDAYLAADHYDEFVVFAKLPDTSGRLYWRVSQICEQGRIDWHEQPGLDVSVKLKTPAAVLEVVPKPGSARQQMPEHHTPEPHRSGQHVH
jgi:uncharacterized protein YcnI